MLKCHTHVLAKIKLQVIILSSSWKNVSSQKRDRYFNSMEEIGKGLGNQNRKIKSIFVCTEFSYKRSTKRVYQECMKVISMSETSHSVSELWQINMMNREFDFNALIHTIQSFVVTDVPSWMVYILRNRRFFLWPTTFFMSQKRHGRLLKWYQTFFTSRDLLNIQTRYLRSKMVYNSPVLTGT